MIQLEHNKHQLKEQVDELSEKINNVNEELEKLRVMVVLNKPIVKHGSSNETKIRDLEACIDVLDNKFTLLNTQYTNVDKQFKKQKTQQAKLLQSLTTDIIRTCKAEVGTSQTALEKKIETKGFDEFRLKKMIKDEALRLFEIQSEKFDKRLDDMCMKFNAKFQNNDTTADETKQLLSKSQAALSEKIQSVEKVIAEMDLGKEIQQLIVPSQIFTPEIKESIISHIKQFIAEETAVLVKNVKVLSNRFDNIERTLRKLKKMRKN